MLLDYLEHLDYLVDLDLFYKSTSSIVCLAIADDIELAIDDTFADIGVTSVDILNRTRSYFLPVFLLFEAAHTGT